MVDKQFDISQPDLLIPQVKIIARTVPNKCLCFSILFDLMTRQDWYTQPNLLQHRTKLALFIEVVASAIPKTYATLQAIGGLAEIFLNDIFVYMFSTLFPKDRVQQIVRTAINLCLPSLMHLAFPLLTQMDYYLLAGSKALFEFGLALMQYHKATIKQDSFATGSALWSHIKRHCDGGTMDYDKFFELAASNRGHMVKRGVPSRSKLSSMRVTAKNAAQCEFYSYLYEYCCHCVGFLADPNASAPLQLSQKITTGGSSTSRGSSIKNIVTKLASTILTDESSGAILDSFLDGRLKDYKLVSEATIMNNKHTVATLIPTVMLLLLLLLCTDVLGCNGRV
jgi:hypothetical protein